MPGVFSAINSRIQNTLLHKKLKTLSSSLPDGEVVSQEGWVDSVFYPDTKVYIKGKYDLLVKLRDGTYTLVDLKLSQPLEEKKDKYMTQLMAYKFALENPRFSKAYKISKIALLIFYPDTIEFKEHTAKLTFPPKWMEISYDEKKFKDFMREVYTLLEGGEPKRSKTCKWCAYRNGEKISYTKSVSFIQPLPF
jgi:CRISPR/Cas system-associated exonuclease Cas4 (RecB family)